VTYLLAQASAHRLPLRNESVQTCVTSPPYWGLRSYSGEQAFSWGGEDHAHAWGEEGRSASRNRHSEATGEFAREGRVPTTLHPSTGQHCGCGAWYGALGLEPTPELYVEHMVEVFREVRRVLRRDGTLWLNLGDSYTSGGRANYDQAAPNHGAMSNVEGRPSLPAGLKPKDLVGIPWRVAFALQADGWYLRSDIVWAKPNPMPESVTDRPTKSHEYLFLLAKSERYFYDSDAIRETGATGSWAAMPPIGGVKHVTGNDNATYSGNQPASDGQRNARSVWNIATQPYPGAHFATFPEELPERCIKAGSAAQACSVCGAPWERQTERTGWPDPEHTEDTQGRFKASGAVATDTQRRKQLSGARHAAFKAANPDRPLGFAPTCTHEAPTVGSVVLDPFNGSGTTGAVALRLGRRYVGFDLSREYLTEQALRRIDPIAAEAQDFRNGVDGAQAVMSL
jgi:DNA modification methylase